MVSITFANQALLARHASTSTPLVTPRRNGSTPKAAPLGPLEDYEEYKFAQRAYQILETWQPSDGPLSVLFALARRLSHCRGAPFRLPSRTARVPLSPLFNTPPAF